MSPQNNTYSPDYTVVPGEILDEYLETRGMSKAEFARRTGMSEKTISQIIHGKAPISAESAIQFERVLGVSAKLWSNLETQYRLYKAREVAKNRLAENVEWSKKFPLSELKKRNIITPTQNKINIVDQLLGFFSVASKEGWDKKYSDIQFACRHSQAFKSDPYVLATWMRCGELEAQNTDCPPYDQITFKNALLKIRNLTREQPEVFEPEMVGLCNKSGVVLSFIEEFAKTHISGITKWVSKDKALIILSLRHKADDHFWFSFFHEAAHVLLHNKRFKTKIFLDETTKVDHPQEDEANRFARNLLIPPDEYSYFIKREEYKRNNEITLFSYKIGVSPGIVVGRLQHDGYIGYNQYNNLKMRFEFNHV